MRISDYTNGVMLNLPGPIDAAQIERAGKIGRALEGMPIRSAKALLDACKAALDETCIEIEPRCITGGTAAGRAAKPERSEYKYEVSH